MSQPFVEINAVITYSFSKSLVEIEEFYLIWLSCPRIELVGVGFQIPTPRTLKYVCKINIVKKDFLSPSVQLATNTGFVSALTMAAYIFVL